MFVTIINDCRDANAFGRQSTRIVSLFGITPSLVGVENDLEAAGNLIDILDAGEGREGIVLVNVAPRHGSGKKYPNGTPFGYFYYKNTLVVSSIDGLTLSLVKKLGLIKEIKVVDVSEVLKFAKEKGLISDEDVELITHTQFRSLEYLPKVAKWLKDGLELPTKPIGITEVQEAPVGIWLIDNFGNCKTTLTREDIDFEVGKKVKFELGELTCYERLKDVPDGEYALIEGSSGMINNKFLELVVQGRSAKEEFTIRLDTKLEQSQLFSKRLP